MVQTYLNLFELIWTYSNLFELIRTYRSTRVKCIFAITNATGGGST